MYPKNIVTRFFVYKKRYNNVKCAHMRYTQKYIYYLFSWFKEKRNERNIYGLDEAVKYLHEHSSNTVG